MDGLDFDIVGTQVEPDKLRNRRASSVARFAEQTTNPNIRLLNCYGCRDDSTEAVALAISATVPQRPFYDIRQTERILITFSLHDALPKVESLRKDFPRAPHTNLTHSGEPRSLCLYDEPWEDVRITLTAPKLISRIMWWLEGTATGTLHGENQQLEPLLFDPYCDLIIPNDLLSNAGTSDFDPLLCYRTSSNLRLVRSRVSAEKDDRKADVGRYSAMVITCQPQQHGVIQATPRTLGDLHTLLLPVGVHMMQTLREQLGAWLYTADESSNVEDSGLVLLVRLPKTRRAGGGVEFEELRAFAFNGTIGAIAAAVAEPPSNADIDLAEDIGGRIKLQPLNPRPGFSRGLAAKANGYRENSSRVVAVGVGALGSQVVVNLVRGGFGQWTLVDKDLLQPHNMARHALDDRALGGPKALGLASMLNHMVEDPPIAEGVVADILASQAPAGSEVMDWKSVEAILDMSASTGVARYLRHDVRSPARRLSLFLNPSGTALTLLAEDRARNIPLDVLEMQHYRALTWHDSLDGFLASASTMRSGAGCRDVSARIPQDLVSLFSGIGSRAVRLAVETDKAQIATWRVDESTYSVTHTTIEVPHVRRKVKDGWRIFWDDGLENNLRDCRNSKLPKETGGILIGSFDVARRIIYVFDATEAPLDSRECPSSFLRGSEGLQEVVDKIQRATNGMLGYIGEWHSHTSANTEPSNRDKDVIDWVKRTLDDEGQVGVVGIVGSRKRLNLIPCGTALCQ